MIDPVESHKTLGRIFIACLLGILLYLLVGAGMTFMDKIGLVVMKLNYSNKSLTTSKKSLP